MDPQLFMSLYTGSRRKAFKRGAQIYQGQPPEAGTPTLPVGTATV
jgi:hypothetical protein